MQTDLQYFQNAPDAQLSEFVESYWMLENTSDERKELMVLPDGRVDVFFSKSATEVFHTTLSGVENHANKGILEPKTVIFAISFKLLAVEFLFGKQLANMLNSVMRLPDGFGDFSEPDLNDFEAFCEKVNCILNTAFLKVELDSRKQMLFQQVYESEGALSIKELSENVFWSSRQINRYFNEHFGLNLKAYCNILRFRASFTQIKSGKFFPEDHFSDQAHFIKEIKKHANVTPKELFKNENNRFIQFYIFEKP